MALTQDHRQGIYAELDTLLDSRLGTIARLSDTLAIRVLDSGYHARETDEFPFIDMQAYRALYAQRDIETLAFSGCTAVMQLLRQLVSVTAEQAVTRPFHTGARVYVNLHPYHFTSEEKDELQKAIAVWLSGIPAEVEFVSISMQSLTPEQCKAMNLAAMFMYDFGAWMEMQAKAFETNRLNDVTVFSPALYSTLPTEEQQAQMEEQVGNLFHAMQMLASPLIDLKLLPVSEFSVIIKPTGPGISTPPAP